MSITRMVWFCIFDFAAKLIAVLYRKDPSFELWKGQ
ncbi:hypothetical protein SRB5_64360 [Streptomyces sp. RB5]|uniref:Uncharacterized protein n=1 Tax=Streptomyces smaragdinus TaxID=2585196 RepID=A0A7K0CRX4_9ACTN|nr:hypothetical protein [Streptomyces smaragdinus]